MTLIQNCYFTDFTADDRLLVIVTDNEGTAYAEYYDPKDGQTERWTLPDVFSRYRVLQGNTADVLLCDSVGVYQLDFGRNAPTEMFSYVDVGLDISDLRDIFLQRISRGMVCMA